MAPRGPHPWLRCGLCGRRFGKIFRPLSQHLQRDHGAELAPKVWVQRMHPELLGRWKPEFDGQAVWLVGAQFYTHAELVIEEPVVLRTSTAKGTGSTGICAHISHVGGP